MDEKKGVEIINKIKDIENEIIGRDEKLKI